MSQRDGCIEAWASPHEVQRMSIQICRGCLSVESIAPASPSLSQAFTQATGVQSYSYLPCVLCVQCKAFVVKCKKFRERAQRVNDVLMQLMITNDLNLTNIHSIKRKLRIKPLLEPTHYPPNHCDVYHDADYSLNEGKNIKINEKDNPENTVFILTTQTTPMENVNSHTQTELRQTFEELLKSPKRELCDTIDHDDILYEEVESASVIEDEEDIKVADVVDSIPMTDDIPDASDSDSIADDPQENLTYSSAKQTTIIENSNTQTELRKSLEDPLKSPKRELCDTIDHDDILYEEVESASVIEDEEDIKVADVVDSIPMTDHVTDSSDSDSIADIPQENFTGMITRGATRQNKELHLWENRKNIEQKNVMLKNEHRLVTESITESAPATSTVTETPSIPTNTSTVIRKEFVCDKCKFKFKSKATIIRHIPKCTLANKINMNILNGTFKNTKSQMGNRLYACKLCNYECLQLSDLKKHLRIHSGEKPFACNICKMEFKSQISLKRHIGTHNMGEKRYVCDICKKQYSRQYHLQRHLRTHTGEKPSFACNDCDFKTSYERSLVQHSKKKHNGEEPYPCKYCDYKCSKSSDLKKHLKLHTEEKPFACNVCDLKFKAKKTLKIHKRTHTGEKPYACNLCDYKSAQRGDIKKHLRIHTGEKPFSCDICNKKFTANCGLNKHLKFHSGNKSYACKFCAYKCVQLCDLKKHLRIHSDEKPFPCNICNLKFRTQSNLKQHIRTHMGDKPYVCDICNKQFARPFHLQRHLRTHTGETPFACNDCNFKCSYKNSLVLHFRRFHWGEEPYACKYCDYKCSNSVGVGNHYRTTHKGKITFDCNFCELKFMQKSYLKIHLRTHKKNNSTGS